MSFSWSLAKNNNFVGQKVRLGHVKGHKFTKIKNFRMENFEIAGNFFELIAIPTI